jgi:hypothetical protein
MKKIFTSILLLTLFLGFEANAQPPLSGLVNLPRLGAFPIPDLDSAVKYLNKHGISGTTIINCSASETAPSGGYVLGSSTLNKSLSATQTLTINGAKRVFTAQAGSGGNDAIFTIQGANYVTLQNFDFRESAFNTTATAMMERGISIVKFNKDTGSKKDNILNTSITLNNTNTTAASGIAPNGATGIFIGNCTYLSNSPLALAASEDGTNDGIFISGCVIKNVTHGIYTAGIQVIADGSSFNDKNLTILSDTIENFTHNGIFLSYSNGDLVNACRINNMSSGGVAPTTNNIFGIRYANNPSNFVTNNNWDCANNNINLTINSAGSFAATGISSQINGSGSTIIENDTIQLTSSGISAQLNGVFCQNNLGTQRIANNLIQNLSTQTTNIQPVLGVFAGGYNTTPGLGVSTIASYPTTSNVVSNRFLNWNVCSGTGTAQQQVIVCQDDNLTANTSNFSNNTVNNIIINNNSQQFMGYGGIWRYGIITLNRTTTVSGNTFSNISTSDITNTTPFFIVNPAGPYPNGHTLTCSKNKFLNMNSALGLIACYNLFDGKLATIDKDTMSGLTSAAWHVIGVVSGFNSANYSTTSIGITNSSMSNFKSNSLAGGAIVAGLQLQQTNPNKTTSFNVATNLIQNLSNTDTAGVAFGINTTGSGAAVYSITNNMISDIAASADTTLFNSSIGINLNSTGTNNVLYNTVRMVTSTTTAKGYGATGLRYNPSSTNTIQNNILHVNVLAGTANNVSAIRSSAGAASSAPSTSAFTASGNIYYSPTGVNNYLYVDGTINSGLVNGFHESGLSANTARNIRNDTFFNSECNKSSYHRFMQTSAATREVRTFTENNLSGTGGVFAPSGMSFAEGSATDGAISVDFLGNPRPFGSSDIGALQFVGTTRPQMLITITSSTGFDTACTFNLPSLSASIPSYFKRVSYQWYRDTTKLIGKTLSSIVVTALSGNYIVRVYDSVTGCEYPSSPYRITIVPPPPAQVSYYDSLTFCESSAIVLNANKGYNYVYQWARNGVDLPGETKDHLVVDKSGNYTVQVNTPLGCPTFSTPTRVKVYPLPKPTIVYGGPGKLSTQKYFLYQWYKNNVKVDSFARNRDFYTLFEGDGAYTVEVTDSNGCTAKSNVYLYAASIEETQVMQIKVYPNPTTALLQISSPIMISASLMDVTGRVLQMHTASRELSFNTSELASGMYLLSLSDTNGKLLRVEKINKID